MRTKRFEVRSELVLLSNDLRHCRIQQLEGRLKDLLDDLDTLSDVSNQLAQRVANAAKKHRRTSTAADGFDRRASVLLVPSSCSCAHAAFVRPSQGDLELEGRLRLSYFPVHMLSHNQGARGSRGAMHNKKQRGTG